MASMEFPLNSDPDAYQDALKSGVYSYVLRRSKSRTSMVHLTTCPRISERYLSGKDGLTTNHTRASAKHLASTREELPSELLERAKVCKTCLG